jgi:hypothetical protein
MLIDAPKKITIRRGELRYLSKGDHDEFSSCGISAGLSDGLA